MPTDAESFEFDLFVSYSTADTEFVERLVKKIESEEYMKRQFRCFYAPWDIQPGENVLIRIEKAEVSSRLVGLVMSPDWLKSDWTTLERVIPVYEDPAGLKGRIIPILRRNCEIPPSIRILNWLDFRHDLNFERELRRLLARLREEPIRSAVQSGNLVSPSRWDSSTAVFQSENLASDLFPALRLPRFVHFAHVNVRNRDEVFSILGEGTVVPPFAIRDEEMKVYSFAPLESKQHRLGELLQGKPTEKVLTSKLIEDGRSTVVIELLNRSMTAHMRRLGMVYDWNTKKTFYPLETNANTSREATWRVGPREFTRKLVVKSKSGQYFAHRSCRATFTKLAGTIYLKVLPGWHFTTDGLGISVTPSKMTSLSTRWMNIERNHTVLDNVRFWASVLSRDSGKILLDVGAEVQCEIAAVPLFATIDHGVEGDYRERLWYEAEPEADEVDEGLEEVERPLELGDEDAELQ